MASRLAIALVLGLAWHGAASGDQALVLPVPVHTIYPGDAILEEALAPRRFRPTMKGRAAMAQSARELAGKVARRTLLPGRPVPLAAVAEPELVRRGKPVEVVYRDGGLTIMTTAMALDPGAVGDTIRLRNMASGITISGRIMPDGRVMVGGS